MPTHVLPGRAVAYLKRAGCSSLQQGSRGLGGGLHVGEVSEVDCVPEIDVTPVGLAQSEFVALLTNDCETIGGCVVVVVPPPRPKFASRALRLKENNRRYHHGDHESSDCNPP